MRMLEFRAIHLYNCSRIPKQDLRRRFHNARLARACGSQEQQIANRPPGRVQPGAKNLIQIHKGLDAFFLPDDFRPQGSLKVLGIAAPDGWIQLMSYRGSHGFFLGASSSLECKRMSGNCDKWIVHGKCHSTAVGSLAERS